MSRRALLPAGGAPLLRLTDEEATVVGITDGRLFAATWAVVVGTGPIARLVARRVRTTEVARPRHIAKTPLQYVAGWGEK